MRPKRQLRHSEQDHPLVSHGCRGQHRTNGAYFFCLLYLLQEAMCLKLWPSEEKQQQEEQQQQHGEPVVNSWTSL